MQVKTLTFADGTSWMRRGLLLMARFPLVLFMAGLTYLFLLILSSQVPGLGLVLPMVLAPILSLGLTLVVQKADSGQMPSLGLMFSPFKGWQTPTFRRLMLLGVVNTLATMAAMAIAGLFDDGSLQKLMDGTLKPGSPSLQASSLMLPVVAFFAVYTPIQLALWFSPLFVAWKNHSVPQALFSSLAAAWHNRAAFIGYMIAWLGLVLASTGVMVLVNLLLGSTSLLTQYLLAPIPILLFSVFFCSFWFSYKDSIDETPERP